MGLKVNPLSREGSESLRITDLNRDGGKSLPGVNRIGLFLFGRRTVSLTEPLLVR